MPSTVIAMPRPEAPAATAQTVRVQVVVAAYDAGLVKPRERSVTSLGPVD